MVSWILSLVLALALLNLMLVVTGDCGDDGCLCNIKIQCKEKNKNESENQVYPNKDVTIKYMRQRHAFPAPEGDNWKSEGHKRQRKWV